MVPEMTTHQHMFAVVMAAALLVFVLELVRRRQLREDYSWLWILASVAIVVVVAVPHALAEFTRLTGAGQSITAASVLGIMFLMVVCIHLCTKLSAVNRQVKILAQEIAITRARQDAEQAEGDVAAG